jgi:chromate transporter
MDIKNPDASFKNLERRKDITLTSLATGFAKMGICSFGGGLTAWAEQIAVRERKWLSEDDFLHALAICQILPGPNMIKLAVYIGASFRGFMGAISALFGLLAIPMVIVMTVGILCIKAGSSPVVNAVLAGLGACAAGMAFSLGIKFATKNMKDWIFVVFGVLSFVTIGIFRLPMFGVIIVLSPLAILAYCMKTGLIKFRKKSEGADK